MDGSTDFSFCQVAFAGDTDQLESPKFMGDRSKDHEDIFRDFGSGPAPLLSLKFNSDAGTNVFQSQNSNLIMEGSHQRQSESSAGFGSSTVKVIGEQSLKAKESEAKVINELGTSISNNLQVDERKKKPVQRAKVPFEKGFSQMDWLKLTRTHPDLADLKGQSSRRLITMDEVKQHNSEGSMWTVLKGRVYNISPYMKYHPGGADMLMKAGGRDGTSLFNKYHAWVNADFLLEKCLVGFLDVS
ncbi:uncharacterized heme-binding protein C330.03c isoform X1 [Nymphaea colorata]|nr:uncharacterized heme-binding protein C330.03c isoform X1 [Nymphaea colorata]XP_031477743.1 uncharacterized heme-binding protein C330.03c isoform X1 [Nymphaea colorata]